MKKREIKCSFYNLIKLNPNHKVINWFRLEILIIYNMDDSFKDRIDLYFRMSNL